MNVLIVDDSMVDRKIMSKVITEGVEGIVIFENTSGHGVLQQVQERSINIIVLDILLPGISGLNILRALKEDLYTQDIPVLICSGIDDDEIIRKSLDLGAYDYFEKPLSARAVKFSMALKVRNALELVRRTQSLNYLQEHDQVSGLYTRQYFEYNLKQYDRVCYLPLTYLMLDIDGLKIINDAYGREAGDRIIKAIGDYVSGQVEGLLMSARWGSDEFILLLSNYEQEECESLVRGLIIFLEKSTHIFRGLNISFGFAVRQGDLRDKHTMIQMAEEHLFSNKLMESNSVRGKLLDAITNTLHEKNPREENHSRRVSELSACIAKELGFSEFEIKKVKTAGLLHDIGKIIVDESVLNKPGKLNHEEWEQIKKHPEMGYRVLSASTDTIDLAKAVLSHHERYDGKGYPQGLLSEEIPLLGRIICVADSYDAMTGPRTYKEVFTCDMAIKEIIDNKGTQFDPNIVDAFVRAIGNYKYKTASE